MCFGPYCPGSEFNFAGTIFMPKAKTRINNTAFGPLGDTGWKTSDSDLFIIPAIGISSPVTQNLRFGLAENFLVRVPYDFNSRKAQERAHCGIHFRVSEEWIFEVDTVLGRLEHAPQSLFALVKRFFHPFSCGNVKVDSHHAYRPIVRISLHDLSPVKNPLPFSGFCAESIFSFVCGDDTCQMAFQIFENTASIIRMDEALPHAGIWVVFFGRVAEYHGPPSIQKDLSGSYVPIPHSQIAGCDG